MTTFLCWWHRVILRHEQEDVMNGETEPGVKCFCPKLITCDCKTPAICDRAHRWFPSDGGRGR